MLLQEQVQSVIRLLDSGMSQREIAQQLGISRGTVGRIATGKRGLWDDERSEHRYCPTLPKNAGDCHRCPGCGGLVYGDCVLCEIRNARRGPNTNIEAVGGAELYGVLTTSHCSGDDLLEGVKGDYIPSPDEIYKVAQEIRERNEESKAKALRVLAIEQAKRLLARGVFESRVAKRTGLSRSTVRKIAQSVKRKPVCA